MGWKRRETERRTHSAAKEDEDGKSSFTLCRLELRGLAFDEDCVEFRVPFTHEAN